MKVDVNSTINLNRRDYFLKAVMTREEQIALITSFGRVLLIDLSKLSFQNKLSDMKMNHISEYYTLYKSEEIIEVLNTELKNNSLLYSATKKGKISIQVVNDIESMTKTIDTNEEDPVVSVGIVSETKGKLALFTKSGRALVTGLDNIRAKNEPTKGIKGITLEDGDELLAAFSFDNIEQTYYFFMTENGYGAKIPLSILREQKRGGKGKVYIHITEKNGRPITIKKIVDSKVNFIYVTEKCKISYFNRGGSKSLIELPTFYNIIQGVKMIPYDEKPIFLSDIELFKLGQVLKKIE
ncbi:DNA gyrase C-terminal beta-propeller domain-containing protein [Neobacillus rhizosphaerae]|uniref:DNA gyrase C-terminal beta-propeller domain-containing protein n=1 Tax=Neobacillus rhizosphaerae TaxID=2880965 RepID=UPI003D2E28EA